MAVFAARYLGGAVSPGDDMRDAEFAWADLTEIGDRYLVAVPTEDGVFERAARFLASESTRGA